MEPIFKIAAAADAAILLRFMQEYCAFDHLPFEERTRQKALEKFLGEKSLGRLWLILQDGDPIGYLILTLGYSFEYGGRDAFIDEVYIRENHRGKGVGKIALAFTEEQCRALGVRALHLEVGRKNTNARALYRKIGFVAHDRDLMTKALSSRE